MKQSKKHHAPQKDIIQMFYVFYVFPFEGSPVFSHPVFR